MKLWLESDKFPSQLTPEEEAARDIMGYLFNPVLKLLLCMSNPKEWAKYGFNSCRQTAIFGAIYLQKILPSYTIVPYTGMFLEIVNGKKETYEHCFIVASKGNRNILIDLSRVTHHLIFHKMDTFGYPQCDDYKDVVLLYKDAIDLKEMYYADDIREFFTNEHPQNVMKTIVQYIDALSVQSQKAQDDFCNKVYSTFTHFMN
jgi:hypothetical protein